MAKIILGARPKNFKRTLTVQLPEGGEGTIELSYKYRTRREFGAFIDEVLARANVTPPAADAPDEAIRATVADAMAKTVEANADYILAVADGWNLDQPFTRDAVEQLCNELPGAAAQIMGDYRAAITEGRLGN